MSFGSFESYPSTRQVDFEQMKSLTLQEYVEEMKMKSSKNILEELMNSRKVIKKLDSKEKINLRAELQSKLM